MEYNDIQIKLVGGGVYIFNGEQGVGIPIGRQPSRQQKRFWKDGWLANAKDNYFNYIAENGNSPSTDDLLIQIVTVMRWNP